MSVDELKFKIGFELDQKSVSQQADVLRKEFGSKTARDIDVITKELERQISVLQLYARTGEMAGDEISQAYREIDKSLKAIPLSTQSVINAQKKLLDAQMQVGKSTTNFNTQLKGTNNTLINFGRVIQDAPFGILGVANNIDPLVLSLQGLSREAGGAGKAFKALGAGLLGPVGIGIAISAVTSLIIAYGDDIAEFFTKPTFDATVASDQFTKQVKEQADVLNEIAGNKKGTLEANQTELNVLQEQIKALTEINKQTKLQTSLLGVEDASAFGGTGENSAQIAQLRNEANIQDKILEALKGQAKEIEGKIIGQSLFNELNGEQKRVLDQIRQAQLAETELVKTARNIEVEDYGALIDAKNELDMQYFADKDRREKDALRATLDRIAFEREALEKSKEAETANSQSIINSQLKNANDATAKYLADQALQKEESIRLEQEKWDTIYNVSSMAITSLSDLTEFASNSDYMSKRVAFKYNQGFEAVQTAMTGARAATEALPNIPLSVGIGLLTASSIAKILSQKPPSRSGGGGSASSGGGSSSSSSGVRGFSTSSTSMQKAVTSTSTAPISSQTQPIIIQNRIDDAGISSLVQRGTIARRQTETVITSD